MARRSPWIVQGQYLWGVSELGGVRAAYVELAAQQVDLEADLDGAGRAAHRWTTLPWVAATSMQSNQDPGVSGDVEGAVGLRRRRRGRPRRRGSLAAFTVCVAPMVPRHLQPVVVEVYGDDRVGAGYAGTARSRAGLRRPGPKTATVSSICSSALRTPWRATSPSLEKAACSSVRSYSTCCTGKASSKSGPRLAIQCDPCRPPGQHAVSDGEVVDAIADGLHTAGRWCSRGDGGRRRGCRRGTRSARCRR